ncbi:MAG TPA: hypothetical protein ENG44_00520 [Desulfurococcaceae archaeon]|nr:hypothetical protein [Desulfurococcaceae archaeon]
MYRDDITSYIETIRIRANKTIEAYLLNTTVLLREIEQNETLRTAMIKPSKSDVEKFIYRSWFNISERELTLREYTDVIAIYNPDNSTARCNVTITHSISVYIPNFEITMTAEKIIDIFLSITCVIGIIANINSTKIGRYIVSKILLRRRKDHITSALIQNVVEIPIEFAVLLAIYVMAQDFLYYGMDRIAYMRDELTIQLINNHLYHFNIFFYTFFTIIIFSIYLSFSITSKLLLIPHTEEIHSKPRRILQARERKLKPIHKNILEPKYLFPLLLTWTPVFLLAFLGSEDMMTFTTIALIITSIIAGYILAKITQKSLKSTDLGMLSLDYKITINTFSLSIIISALVTTMCVGIAFKLFEDLKLLYHVNFFYNFRKMMLTYIFLIGLWVFMFLLGLYYSHTIFIYKLITRKSGYSNFYYKHFLLRKLAIFIITVITLPFIEFIFQYWSEGFLPPRERL